MKKSIFTPALALSAMLVMSGCGGGSDTQPATKKDAAYYKKAYRDYTSVKSLHKKGTTLFTIDALQKSLDDFNITTTTQESRAYKMRFVEQFKANLESKVANGNTYVLGNKSAILIPNDENSTPVINGNKSMDLLSELSDTFKQVGPPPAPPCCEGGIDPWISAEFIAYLDDNSDVDENNDSQPLIAVLPEAPKEIQELKKKVELDDYFYGGSLVTVPKLRDDFGKAVDATIK